MKKRLSLLLAAIMGASVAVSVAGCGSSYSDEIDWDVDLSKPIEINALYPDTGLADFESGNNDTAKIIEKTTGYKVHYSQLVGTGDTDVDNALTERTQYHIMKLTSAQYTPYLEQDAFLDLTDLLKNTESGRKLYELIDLMPYGWDSVTYTNKAGKTGIYAIPDFGYCVMEDSALVWNTAHLKAIGHVDENGDVIIPETLSDVTETLLALQDYYGSDTNYHAFGIPGSNSVRVTPLMCAFNCPLEFYVDDEGKVQLYVYDESCNDYVNYMQMYKQQKLLSDSWQNSTASDLCLKFANEQVSCVYMTYWWVTPLINAIVEQGVFAEKYGYENTYDSLHDEAVVWNTRVRGDGDWSNGEISYTAPNQEKAMMHGGNDGVSYYTVIPYYMAKDALYIIDFLAKKLENFATYYGGEEGVHWNKVDAPAGAPEYDPSDPFCMLPYEDYKNKIIYMRPYEYEYQGETVKGGGYWIQLTDRYIEQIVNNSQFCNGTNPVEAEVLFHLRETGFDAWQVTVPMDDSIITNPMTMAPPFEWWSPVNIASRTKALRGLASAIDARSGVAADSLDITRASLLETFTRVNGVKYYYWSEDISNEMTEWYNTVKLGK